MSPRGRTTPTSLQAEAEPRPPGFGSSRTLPGGEDHELGATSAWFNKGNYVSIQGFDLLWESHELPSRSQASYALIIGNHIYGNQNGSYGGKGGAIVVGNYPSSGTVGITTGNQIIGNVVNNCGVPGVKSSTQGHGIYIRDTGPIVQNNIVYNNSGVGIVAWHAATNLTISNNLVWGNLEVESRSAPAIRRVALSCNNCIVSNNISINNGDYGIQEYGAVGANNVFLNNCLYGNSVASTSLKLGHVAQNTVTSNAGFVNYRADGTGDYHLAAGSPAINAGTSQGAPTTDYDGVSRPTGRRHRYRSL